MSTQISRGADFNVPVTDYAKALLNDGLTFVVRYICYPGESKFLTKAEDDHLHAEGLLTAVVFENGYPIQPGYFSDLSGVRDGQNAAAWTPEAGRPGGTVLYYAIDTDLTNGQITALALPYAQAFRDNCPNYHVRPYGSMAVIQAIVAAGYSDGGYVSGSTGWANYGQAQGSPLTKIMQTGIDNYQIPGTAILGDGDHAWGESGAV